MHDADFDGVPQGRIASVILPDLQHARRRKCKPVRLAGILGRPDNSNRPPDPPMLNIK